MSELSLLLGGGRTSELNFPLRRASCDMVSRRVPKINFVQKLLTLAFASEHSDEN
jgi:hypothetical protein